MPPLVVHSFVEFISDASMSLSTAQLQSQFENFDDDRATEAIVANMVLAGLAIIAVILRLWSRKLVSASWKADDYLIIAGLIFALANCFQIFPGTEKPPPLHLACPKKTHETEALLQGRNTGLGNMSFVWEFRTQ